MTLFVDASAIVAMLVQEADALPLADRLDHASDLLWSPIVQWETAAALVRTRTLEPHEARAMVLGFGRAWQFRLVAIGEQESEMAFDAFRLYGKGQPPARLNMGDCFAYACARTNNVRLLYKGDDFSKTDLA